MSYIKTRLTFEDTVTRVYSGLDDDIAPIIAKYALTQVNDRIGRWASYSTAVESIQGIQRIVGPDPALHTRLLLVAAWLSTYNGYHPEAEALAAEALVAEARAKYM